MRWLNFLPALIFTLLGKKGFLGKNGLGEKYLIKKLDILLNNPIFFT
jgi:hypothetical protein